MLLDQRASRHIMMLDVSPPGSGEVEILNSLAKALFGAMLNHVGLQAGFPAPALYDNGVLKIWC